MKHHLSLAGLALAMSASLAAQAPPDGLLRWMDSIAQHQLDARAEALGRVQTVAEAERRKQEARAKILEHLGGLPDYDGPLNPQVTGRIERPGYVIEKLYFESLPRLFVTANLYRPTAPGRHPAVLLPLGHWEEGKPAVQLIAGNLALKGFVVLTYDPLGQGERQQAYDPRIEAPLAGSSVLQHWMAGAQALLIGQSFARYRIWDGKRALDYLVGRPEVDAERIGITGCSGGGTLTSYISALDPRVKAAAAACYITSFRELYSGPVGDSEQSLPDFLSSGLDLADYIELFAPKPWLISSTLGDFFPVEGTRQAYEEARRWYRLYGAEDKIGWIIGPGEHGTPRQNREAIYAWMIRWLADGKGDATEQPIEIRPPFEFDVTKTGQVSTGLNSRDISDVIREDYQRMKRPGGDLAAALRRYSPEPPSAPPAFSVVSETRAADLVTEKLELETEPGLALQALLLVPRAAGRKPGVVVVETFEQPSARALDLARAGAVVLSLYPRGKPAPPERGPYVGDWLSNTRAWLIGRNMPGLRAYDIRRGIDLLAARPDVDAARLRVAARGVSGVWALMAAALDARISALWLDRTPYSLADALTRPVHRELHDAVLPGFLLQWDLADLRKLIEPRRVLWTDPTDWLGQVRPLGPAYLYRPFQGPDEPYVKGLLQ